MTWIIKKTTSKPIGIDWLGFGTLIFITGLSHFHTIKISALVDWLKLGNEKFHKKYNNWRKLVDL